MTATGKRRLLWLCCVILLAVLALSLFAFLLECGHHCTGENCPVCRMLAACALVWKALALLTGVAALGKAAALGRPQQAARAFCRLAPATPVSQRVKLSD